MTNRRIAFLLAWTFLLLLVAAATDLTSPPPPLGKEQSPASKVLADKQWVLFEDNNHGFRVEHPSDWTITTLIEQQRPYAEPEKIIRKYAFAGPEGYTTLSVFLSNGLDLASWLKNQNEASPNLFPAMGANGTVAGHPAVVFMVDDNLIAFTGNDQYVFRFWHPMSDDLALQVNWHVVNSFRLSRKDSATSITYIPDSVIREAEDSLDRAILPIEQADSCTSVQGAGCCDLPHLQTCYRFPCARENGQDKGNCTYLVCYKYGGVPFSGNAGTWWGQVRSTPGSYSHTTPPKGTSIAWWGGSPGHVGFIQYYSGSGTPSVIEQSYCDYCTRTRSTWAQGYIQKGLPPARAGAYFESEIR